MFSHFNTSRWKKAEHTYCDLWESVGGVWFLSPYHCTSFDEILQEADDTDPALKDTTVYLGRPHHHKWKSFTAMKL